MSPVFTLDDDAGLGTAPAVPALCRIKSPDRTVWLHVGDLAVISAQFLDPASTTPPVDTFTGYALVNPTTVEAAVMFPDGSEQTVALSVIENTWSATVPITMSGTHWFRVIATGSYQAVDQRFWQVRQDRS